MKLPLLDQGGEMVGVILQGTLPLPDQGGEMVGVMLQEMLKARMHLQHLWCNR